jgi:hypothetical protein
LVNSWRLYQQRIRHVYRRQRPASTPELRRAAKGRQQLQLGVDGLDVAHLATLNDSVLRAQVSSRCLVDERPLRGGGAAGWGCGVAAGGGETLQDRGENLEN